MGQRLTNKTSSSTLTLSVLDRLIWCSLREWMDGSIAHNHRARRRHCSVAAAGIDRLTEPGGIPRDLWFLHAPYFLWSALKECPFPWRLVEQKMIDLLGRVKGTPIRLACSCILRLAANWIDWLANIVFFFFFRLLYLEVHYYSSLMQITDHAK